MVFTSSGTKPISPLPFYVFENEQLSMDRSFELPTCHFVHVLYVCTIFIHTECRSLFYTFITETKRHSYAMPPINPAVLSNVSGYMSIALWVVVYSPQIWENYQLKSGEGLSVPFIILWLLGDITNLFGGVMAHLLPTVIILAVYVSSFTQYNNLLLTLLIYSISVYCL